MGWNAAISTVLLTALLFAGLTASTMLSPDVQQLCDDYANWRVQDMPEFATFVGIHDYDDLLDDLSMEAYEMRLSNTSYFLERIEGILPNLTHKDDIVNVQVMQDNLETYRDGFPFKTFYIALNNIEGVQLDFTRLLSWMKLATKADYMTMLARMEKLPVQVEQIIALMAAGMDAGIVLHQYSMDKVASEIEGMIVSNAEDSIIYQTFFTSFPENITKDDVIYIQGRASAVIASEVVPSYQQLLDFVSTNYVTRPDIAVTSLPNGTALYAQLIRFCTGTNSTPEEIQQLGYSEVDRIQILMQEIVYEMGYNISTQEFSTMIRDDPSNYYSTEEELLTGFKYIIYNVTEPALPQIFKNIPSIPLEVVADASGTGAFYLAGSYDGSRPGVFYVGTEDLGSQPKYGMLTLALHESNPGHHLQGSHALESPTMPYFRSTMEDRNYGHSPSRFPLRSFYYEGWALYAEATGFDMDLYGNSLDRYGHYSEEIFRACRLVVDTGIHALGWSRQQAIDYILEHTAMTPLDVQNEINRYITWPGQALSYKIGQLQISGYRSDAEQRLGDNFNIKDFHDVILESIGPMTVVEDQVNDWILSVIGKNALS